MAKFNNDSLRHKKFSSYLKWPWKDEYDDMVKTVEEDPDVKQRSFADLPKPSPIYVSGLVVVLANQKEINLFVEGVNPSHYVIMWHHFLKWYHSREQSSSYTFKWNEEGGVKRERTIKREHIVTFEISLSVKGKAHVD